MQKSPYYKVQYTIPDTYLLVRDLPADERPREKLVSQGPEALSLPELMATVLQTGTTRESILEMTNRIVRGYGEDNILTERSAKRLSEEADIPLTKACQIVAVGELGRRMLAKNDGGFTTIRNAQDVHDYLPDMRNLPKEYLRGLFLNSHNRVIRNEVISIGTIDSSIIHPREVFRPGIESGAAAVILVHNHPSGEVTPSAEDVKVTDQLVQAGKILGIRVLDHVIITKDAFASVINK